MVKVSVVMTAYNCEKYIGETIESILSQSYKNFEFIIIDDYSNDSTYKICKDFSKNDFRIKLFKNKKNLGVVKTRNKLFDLISKESKYIAIIDADDIARIDRLEMEYNFLQNNNDYSIIGSDIEIINENSKVTGYRKYPKTNNNVGNIICKKSPLAQPSVMIRKKSLEKIGKYNENFERCQDYELWFRFFDNGFKIGNISEPLLKYRVFSEQGKSKHLKLSLKNTIKIQKKYIFNKKYFSILNFIYFSLENILLLFPSSFILWLFKKLEYKKG